MDLDGRHRRRSTSAESLRALRDRDTVSPIPVSQDLIDIVDSWHESNDPDLELDFSGEQAKTLPSIPPAARRIDISDNKLSQLPALPAGTISLIARDNDIKRLPDEFLESIFTKSADCYFDFEGNPLQADQIGRIREVTQAPGYNGPQIIFSAPAGMVFDDEKDLTEVGTSKLIGYLPNHKLADAEGMAIQLQGKGLTTSGFHREECGITSGALYAYDAPRLATFLNLPENKHVLDKYGVPSAPDEYIRYIATTRVQKLEKPDLFDLIALTFNDPGTEYNNRRIALADLTR